MLASTIVELARGGPDGQEPTRLFAIKLYTADLVPTEPVWTEDVQATTPHYAYAISTVPPDEADSGKVVERTFYPLTIDKNMPERIYIVLWNPCTQVPRGGRMELRGDRVIAERYAGQFFRYSCPGTTKIPTGKCAYRPE